MGNAPLLLYSVNTWLAYIIAQRFYKQTHYVWCTPFFDSASIASHDATVPPTSSPSEIYRNLYLEVRRGDRHSSKIKDNKAGILRGANIKSILGDISDFQERDIAEMVDLADARDFRPLLYIMPFAFVKDRLVEVPVKERAHPLSVEYVISDLPRVCFDIIEFNP